MIAARQLRIGLVIRYNNELYRVVSVMHRTPGNLRAFVQAKLFNLKKNDHYDIRLRAEDIVEDVMLERKTMEYIYNTDDIYTFMDTTTYEQVDIPKKVLGDAVDYILPNTQLDVEFYEGTPLGIQLPITVDLKIVDTQPPLKSATASASPKSATLETGIVVKVPQFLQVGETVRIDTRTKSFIERVK
ncbi:MAG: elongation factor P [Candidatus Abyssobacteria bacterium SURF_5]|uniref:Elongation factor P n=1 Tax=Abyssobacteria bacterium (strain SURF_5) TaxID=2093360 RepID=A0A3A4N876_ABYX5|nr:MAG: elongation factor P [Candidatus Abyssubacteria bacterium SURF_5]